MYISKLKIRSFPQKKKELQKDSIIKLIGVYNSKLQFFKTFEVPGKWLNHSDSFFPAEHEY